MVVTDSKLVAFNNKRPVEHIPCAQPRSYMLLVCFVYERVCYLYIYMYRGYTFNFAGREWLCCCIVFAAIVCISSRGDFSCLSRVTAYHFPYKIMWPTADYAYRIAGKFRGVLIFVIFLVELVVTKFSTNEN